MGMVWAKVQMNSRVVMDIHAVVGDELRLSTPVLGCVRGED